MNKEEAQQKIRDFFKNYPMLTFSIEQSVDSDEWMAQCNEVDSIITCGKGDDMSYMEGLMKDAILTAAQIPAEFSENILKRVWNPDMVVPVNATMEGVPKLKVFPSIYKLETENSYATVGTL